MEAVHRQQAPASGPNPAEKGFKRLFTGLQGTLLLAFITIPVVTVGLVATIGIFLSVRNAQTLVFDELLTEVELNEQAVNNWIKERQHDLAVIVNDPSDVGRVYQILQGDRGQAYQSFGARLEVETGPSRRFEEMFLLDDTGQVIISTKAENVGRLFDDAEYFQKGLLAPYVSTPAINADTGQDEIVITVPVRDEFGGLIGVLAGRLDLEELARIILARRESTLTGETYLVSGDNRFLTPPRAQVTTTMARSEGIDQALTPGPARNGEGIYNNYQGVQVAGAYRWLPELEIALISERAVDEALAGVQQLILFTGLIAVGVLALAVVLALYVTSRIVRPVRELTNVATAVAEGDLTQVAHVEASNEIGTLASAFNTMTQRLRNLIDTLEDRIQTRTRALETSGEISRQITSILDTDSLLEFVVNRLHQEFGFYHTHIYLVEEGTNDLVMSYGFGAVGRQLKEQGHRLQPGQGIVGSVASNNQHFLSNNVDEVANFVRNPLLPKTHSELAVPLRKGDQVLGVLDIQSEQTNRFTDEDIDLMQAIANQTAVALDNTRLLQETQQALREVERLNRRLTRETWDQFAQESTTVGYHYINGAATPLAADAPVWLSPMKQAAKTRQLVKQNRAANGDDAQSELAVPLVLRNEVIGVLGVKREKNPVWVEEEVAAVETMAEQIARALENARLSKEQEKTIEQLKEVDRLKSEFLTSMSHELRTPLNSIIGFADVLLQGIDGELNQMALNDIQLIYNSGQHLLALINDILDLSKIEAEKMELVLEEVDVHETVHEVLASASSLIKNKTVQVVVNVEEQLPAVQADRLRLTQILLNLVSNAAKFTEKGNITIDAFLPADAPDKMRIAVIDSGIGISADKQETIFDRFRQADSSTTRKYGGSGLGLAICKKLVEMHGGEIGVKSEPGEGAEFFFTIPLAQKTNTVISVN